MGRLLDQRNEATLSELSYRKKLIEVGLPLEAINKESAREKSIRHGHPSTLHLWWARRPLATARAVLFGQLVDDPSSHPELFPTVEEQDKERERLHRLIEKLVVWENSNDEQLFKEAAEEIRKSNGGVMPEVLDPFAGGGTIPLEAQRLGCVAHASDLNPVAVLINKALIEIPPKFAGKSPVHPDAEQRTRWERAEGLAEDVRRYGKWMRDEAYKRIGHLYPTVTGPDGKERTVIAWIWARTVKSPNPANPIEVPLVRSWWLGKKKGKEAWIKPSVVDDKVRYEVMHNADGPKGDADGTVSRNGAVSVIDGTPISLEYIREEARAGRMGVHLIAVVGENIGGRLYASPTSGHMTAAQIPRPDNAPTQELPEAALGFRVQNYGFKRWSDLFTNRQLIAMTTFSDLVAGAREQVLADSGDETYADAVTTYLALSASRTADYSSANCSWHITGEKMRNVFGRQAIPMVWDYAESNPFSSSSGNYSGQLEWVGKVVESLPAKSRSDVVQASASSRNYSGEIVSTDPPYYDNIDYANLSDFFFVWLRRILHNVYPELFSTVLTPKAEELVANPYRHDGSSGAERFFVEGFNSVFTNIRQTTSADVPVTVYYAYKQQDNASDGTASTGWHTLLDGLIQSGWEITATWPVRSELSNRPRSQGSNALASSIVLACRPRLESAEATTRRAFISVLKQELPQALRMMMQGSIAPVDLAQAAIGPGISVFSRYSRVREADGKDMSVRDALLLINQTLDEVLNEQETDFDQDTRFSVKWYQSFGWGKVDSGEADTLARATSTSIPQLERGGIFEAKGGKARLLTPTELSGDWNPDDDPHISIWEAVARLSGIMARDGAERVAVLLPKVQTKVNLDAVKELGFLLYHDAKNTEDALLFNSLVGSWGDLSEQSRAAATRAAQKEAQSQMVFED
jgi:putative DNA methylase